MKTKTFHALIILLFSISFKGNTQNYFYDKISTVSTKFGVELIPKSSLIVLYNDRNAINRKLVFNNDSNKDTVISISLFLDKPTQFTFGARIIPNPQFYSVLLLPGDSVILAKNDKIKYSTGFLQLLDDMLNIPSSFYEGGKDDYGLSKTKDIMVIIKRIDSIFKVNLERINKWTDLDEKKRLHLYDFNMMLKHRLFSKINYRGLPEMDLKTIDSLYAEIANNMDNLMNINLFNYATIARLRYYNALRNGYDEVQIKANIWSSLDKIDVKIRNSKAYMKERYMYVENSFVDNSQDFGYEKLGDIDFNGLKRNTVKDAVSDSISKLVSILLMTKTDFKMAKEALTNFNNGSHLYLFDKENSPNRENRSIANLPEITMFTTKNEKTTLIKEMARGDAKIFVIDFWANWCAPCIADYPYLKKVESELKGKSIKFLSVSIDKKEDTKKWINKLQELGGGENNNSFILEDFLKSPITNFLGLRMIPRYVVVDVRGIVLEEKFYGPQEMRFKKDLIQYLEKYK